MAGTLQVIVTVTVIVIVTANCFVSNLETENSGESSVCSAL